MTPPAFSSRAWRPVAGAALALVLGVSAAACGGSSSPSSSGGPSTLPSQTTQGGQKLAAIWPLTGLPGPSQAPQHPALVVKIPNTPEAQPQVGMSKADLVYEELVEGGITRLGVAFYQHVPSSTGPVRSMRTSDIDIVKSAKATIVASGAAPPVLGALRQAHVPYFTEGGPGYYRVGNRQAPYNLLVHLGQLAATLKKHVTVPANYFAWGSQSAFTGSTKAGSIAVHFSNFRTTQWRFQGGRYTNTNSFAPANDQFKPNTVIVVRVREGVARYRDPAGNAVPVTEYRGKGSMLMFHDGKVERGTWHKPNGATPVSFTDAKGATLKVPAGHVFLELVPLDQDGGHVSWTK